MAHFYIQEIFDLGMNKGQESLIIRKSDRPLFIEGQERPRKKFHELNYDVSGIRCLTWGFFRVGHVDGEGPFIIYRVSQSKNGFFEGLLNSITMDRNNQVFISF